MLFLYVKYVFVISCFRARSMDIILRYNTIICTKVNYDKPCANVLETAELLANHRQTPSSCKCFTRLHPEWNTGSGCVKI